MIELTKPTENLGLAYKIGNPLELTFDILINPLLNKDEYLELKEIVVNKGFGRHLKDSDLAKWLKPELW